MAEVNSNVSSVKTDKPQLAAPEKHAARMLLKTMLDSGASSFGKAFVLYALPMSILRGGQLKKTILQRASAIAAFMGIVKAAQIFLFQHKSQWVRYYSQAIAGGLGASVALGIDRGLGYNTLVIWFTIRAGRCLLEENVLGQWINNIPHLPTIIMCLSASQILSSWVRYPKELDATYKRFLDHHGGRPRWVLNKLNAPNMPTMYPLYIIRKPGTNIWTDAISFFCAGLIRASKLYAPLYVAALLFSAFQPKNYSFDRLYKLLTNFLSNVGRSSMFLSAYCTIAWISWPILYLFYRSMKQGSTRVSLRRHTWAAGLATLLERKERRPELAAYCATYAIDSVWKRLENSHPIFKTIQPAISAILLIASCSILLHHYNKQPALVTKWVLGFNTDQSVSSPATVDNDDEKPLKNSVVAATDIDSVAVSSSSSS